MAKSIDQEKEKAFNMSKGYENEITNLSHERSRLKEELMKADVSVERLTSDNAALEDRLYSQTAVLKD